MSTFKFRATAAVIVGVLLSLAGVSGTASAATSTDVVAIVNSARADAGLGPLVQTAALDSVAQAWAAKMGATGTFAHSSLDWRASQLPAGWTSNGENIAYGFSTPTQVMAAWMGSAGHRANILRSNFTTVGIGYVPDGNYWVQVFAGYEKTPPYGSFDSVVSKAGSTASITASGWTIDPSALTTPIDVHLYVTTPKGATSVVPATANTSRPDVGTVYRAAGSSHGYSVAIPADQTGVYKVCAYAIGIKRGEDNNTALGCRSVSHVPSKPIGSLDEIAVTLKDGVPVLQVRGWVLDLMNPATSTEAHVYITDPAGRTTGAIANATEGREDVGRAFAGAGAAHGFRSETALTKAGAYRVCAYSIGAKPFRGSNSAFPCATVRLGPSAPIGSVDVVAHDTSTNSIEVSGWTMDAGLRGVVNETHVYVTDPAGRTRGYIAEGGLDRPDVAKAFVGAGAAHGFSQFVEVDRKGTYRVCSYSITAKALGNGHTALPCRSITIR